MRHAVSPQPWLSASSLRLLPPPKEPALPRCACGAELDLEMKRDAGQCVDCQAADSFCLALAHRSH